MHLQKFLIILRCNIALCHSVSFIFIKLSCYISQVYCSEVRAYISNWKKRIESPLNYITSFCFMAKKGILPLKWSQMINSSFRNSSNHVERTYIANKTQYIVIPAWKVKMLFKWHKNHKVKLFLERKDVIFWINYWTSLMTFLRTSASHYLGEKLLTINLTSSSSTLGWQEKRTIF